MPLEVCHSCGIELSRLACVSCGGECQKIDCELCERHFCHACHDEHSGNLFRHDRMIDSVEGRQLKFAATSREKEK